ncbi:sensor histidine kinase [Streptomyces sp. NBC_00059]|uniref:sensor histidine kinase n=1 Tax=Streptomyces sp. NBC_00059 TaxID=2975635 RepID=UPI00224CDBE1|nr:histidine kinase [Streptomyces sp. NBC_00059]MCX5414162.1 histidine kinase [Streptomyces sp. NBC_00059]
MRHFLGPLAAPVTYSRWLHLLIPSAVVSVWLFISMDTPWMPFVFAVPAGLLPAIRLVEGVQAQLLLTPAERGRADASISVAPATTWAERWRTVAWLEVRLLLAAAVGFATVWLPATTFDLVCASIGARPSLDWLTGHIEARWLCALLAPLPILILLGLIVLCGEVATAAARGLLGPSPTERLTALEERTEQLLERNRIARELHDSIGHALTVAVVQAGAARTAGDPEFTDRALAAIEETGRNALDDLERVLRVLRESDLPVSGRPTLAEADRLLDSARGSGVKIEAELTGPLELVPGPVSREGYRILQESLTNVLRHAGAVPVRVRIVVVEERLELEVANPLAGSPRGPGGGSGLRGIRERAALLGGRARTGPHEGEWRVSVSLPLDRIR